jgi:hypothetical protein
MVYVIRISTSGDFVKAENVLNRAKKRLPEMSRLGMKRWGNILERDLKRSAFIQAGIKNFTGTLQSTGIRYEQGEKSDVGRLFIRQYGIYLDSMAPHFVNVKRRRSGLLAWAKRANADWIRKKANLVEQRKLSKFSIHVKPHPFIVNGYRTARPKLRAVLKRVANKSVAAL